MVELENHKPVIPVVITESGKDQGMLTQWVTISSPREALPHLVITNTWELYPFLLRSGHTHCKQDLTLHLLGGGRGDTLPNVGF